MRSNRTTQALTLNQTFKEEEAFESVVEYTIKTWHHRQGERERERERDSKCH